MFRKFIFLINESMKALSRAKVQAIISSITIAITLFIFSIAYYSLTNMIGYSHDFKRKYRIDVFFNPEIEMQKGIELFNKILLIDGIEQGDFIDKDEASKEFFRLFNYDVVEIIGENPLPYGGKFEIDKSYRKAEEMEKIVNEIRLIPGVDLALFSTGLIMRIDKIISNIVGIGFIIGIGIFVISVILVSNTIRLIIHAKRTDIHTLRLLGATDMFIKFPFVMEGILQGLIGAGLSLISLTILKSVIYYILGEFSFVILEPAMLISGNIMAGCLLGIYASYRSISKYLH